MIELFMQSQIIGYLAFLLIFAVLYFRLPAKIIIVIFSLYLLRLDFSAFFWCFYLLLISTILVPYLRRNIITKNIVKIIKKLNLLPRISDTEKIALTSGTVWVDGELFSGKPNFSWIFNQPYPKLSQSEKSFLENEVDDICKICNDYQVQIKKDLPPEVWQMLKDKKFFGMIIPKSFGGLGFSALGHSSVIEKLSSRSVPLAITAMVPNSLGPAELLLHYGTKEQQEYYLPRLASGLEIPCFALTETMAGSDATSISSTGVIFKNEAGEIKIRLNWSKRYITLGAFATLIGVAFKLKDPDSILGNKVDIGITCALIPSNTIGVIQGRRHDPLATPFVNSPVDGVDVVVGIDAIIGGVDGAGKGWKMLMECLAAGRGISLPSTSSGGSKLATRVVTNYSILRKQFGLSISKFEGIEEVLARISAKTYILEALRSFTAGSVDIGAKPAVVSAIAKYHSTELFRQNINDSMDILGGRAIIRGSRNLLANAYFSTPISITVEGANILTRSLIHFGQGAIMCHPYAYKEMIALENNDLKSFDRLFFAHIYHLVTNIVNLLVLSLTRGKVKKVIYNNPIGKYQQKISWCSAVFAVLADFSLAKFGGNLKRKEKLNGRFGDVLSAMYLAVAVIKKFENDGKNAEELELVRYALNHIFTKADIAINLIIKNLFTGWLKFLSYPLLICSRVNVFANESSDTETFKIVKNLTSENSSLLKNITNGVYTNNDPEDPIGRIENAINIHNIASKILAKINQELSDKMQNSTKSERVKQAFEQNIITEEELDILNNYEKILIDVMKVDEYSIEDYNRI